VTTSDNAFLPVMGERTPVAEAGAVIAARRPIQLRALNHVAIRVNELEKAEAFYTSFFGMAVIGRARRGPTGGYRPVATGYDPRTAFASDSEADVTFLASQALTFALRRVGRGDRVETNAVLDHISVDVDIHGFAELRAEVLMRNFDVLMLAPQALTFRDPFGVVWEVTLDEIGVAPEGTGIEPAGA
jgi:catechol 2,3-dioxygenase-like lactoylglutathione lyase family enzyme